MMGFWVLGTFVASLSYGYVYSLTLKMNFMVAYATIAIILLVVASSVFFFEKKLASLVELKPGETLVEE